MIQNTVLRFGADVMPIKNKLPEWEREDNRAKTFTLLLEKSLTFGELLNEVGLSRSTLSGHLSDLQEDELIEKAIEKNRVVYQTTLDAKKIETEFKRLSYDMLLAIAERSLPKLGIFLKIILFYVVQVSLINKKRLLEGKTQLSILEIFRSPEYENQFRNAVEKLDLDQDHLEILTSMLTHAGKEFSK